VSRFEKFFIWETPPLSLFFSSNDWSGGGKFPAREAVDRSGGGREGGGGGALVLLASYWLRGVFRF